MKLTQLLLFLVLASCSHSSEKQSQASNSDTPVIPVTEVLLDNGFKVLLIPNKKIPVFSLYMYYKVGSKYERKGITGASHFLEHMMFKGAKKFQAGRFDYLIEGNGGESNAYTNMDFTVYYEKLPKDHLKTMIEVEADRMQNLLLDPKAFENERNVILEERRVRYENSPYGKLYLAMMKEMQKGTPYEESVIGTISDLKTVSREEIKNYFDQFYTPNNAFMVVAGDFDVEDTKDWVKKYFKNIKRNDQLEKIKNKVIQKDIFKMKLKGNRNKAIYGTSPRPIFALSFPGVKIGTKDAYTLDLISSILAGGRSSYLNQIFVESNKPQLTSISAANYNLVHNGVFYISGELLGKINLAKFEKKLSRALSKFCDQEITERNLQKIKNQILVSTYSGLDTNTGLATYIGDREAYFGDWKIYQKELNTYKNIQIEEAKTTCKKYLGQKNKLFISVWNKNKERIQL